MCMDIVLQLNSHMNTYLKSIKITNLICNLKVLDFTKFMSGNQCNYIEDNT